MGHQPAGKADDGQELIVTPYAYYARVSSWDAAASQNGAADELTDRRLAPGRVRMSDMVWLTQIGDPKLHYNHGDGGCALPDEGEETPAPIAGANRLYGDGSAHWRDRSTDAQHADREAPRRVPRVGRPRRSSGLGSPRRRRSRSGD